MYSTYILLSKSGEHWYIGSCEDISKRLQKHNQGGSRSTRLYRPWKVVYSEDFPTRSEAFRRERYLKSPKGYLEYRKIKISVLANLKSGEFA